VLVLQQPLDSGFQPFSLVRCVCSGSRNRAAPGLSTAVFVDEFSLGSWILKAQRQLQLRKLLKNCCIHNSELQDEKDTCQQTHTSPSLHPMWWQNESRDFQNRFMWFMSVELRWMWDTNSRGGANPRSSFPLPLPADSFACITKSTACRVNPEWSYLRRTLPKITGYRNSWPGRCFPDVL